MALPLFAGAVIGFAVHGALDKPVEIPATAVVAAPPPVVTSLVSRVDAEALRARIRELEKLLGAREERLAELAAQPAEVSPPAAEAVSETRAERPRRESFRERMERMKQENPERYAEMQKRREDFQARMRAAGQEREDYLASVDTSRMSAEQKAAHERLIATLKMGTSLMERLRPDAENPLTDEERQQAFAAMRDIGPLMEQERRYLLEETGRAYGEEGAVFAEYIQEIYENTSLVPGMGRMLGPRPAGGGGPRRGGNAQ